MLIAQHRFFRRLPVAVRRVIDLTEGGAPVPPEEIDGRIGSDSGEPVGRFFLVLELFLVLESLDEGFLSQILSVGDVADDAIDLQEDTP